jgi:hypothetical protein
MVYLAWFNIVLPTLNIIKHLFSNPLPPLPPVAVMSQKLPSAAGCVQLSPLSKETQMAPQPQQVQ